MTHINGEGILALVFRSFSRQLPRHQIFHAIFVAITLTWTRKYGKLSWLHMPSSLHLADREDITNACPKFPMALPRMDYVEGFLIIPVKQIFRQLQNSVEGILIVSRQASSRGQIRTHGTHGDGRGIMHVYENHGARRNSPASYGSISAFQADDELLLPIDPGCFMQISPQNYMLMTHRGRLSTN